MDYETWIIQSISATVWGIVFCWLLKKSKTIWNPIIAHVVYDVFATAFVG
jgi:membrane protease YdiL (CAAX protease family)